MQVIPKKLYFLALILILTSCKSNSPLSSKFNLISKERKELRLSQSGSNDQDDRDREVLSEEDEIIIGAAGSLTAVGLSTTLLAIEHPSYAPIIGRNFKTTKEYLESDKFNPKKADEVTGENAKATAELLDNDPSRINNKRIKALILMSDGGGGHISATESIEKTLLRVQRNGEMLSDVDVRNYYNLLKKNKFNVHGRIEGLSDSEWQDLRKFITGSLYEVKHVDPFFLPTSGWNQAMKTEDGAALRQMVKAQPVAEVMLDNPLGRRIIESRMKEAFPGDSIDLVIKAEHPGTSAVKKICRDLDVQLRLVPTDYKIKNFVLGDSGPSRNDDLSFRVDAPTDISGQAGAEKIKGVYDVGYASRWEFLDLSNDLYSEDLSEEAAQRKKAAQGKVQETMDDLINRNKPDGNQKLTFNPDTDRSILIMMGGNGTSSDRMKKYAVDIASQVNSIGKEGGTVHLVVAQADPGQEPEKSVDNYETKKKEWEFKNKNFKELKNAVNAELAKNSSSSVTLNFQPLGRVEAHEVATLMHSGVTLTKAGGGTIAELEAMRGQAIFDMNLSEYVDWEKYAAEDFERKNWGSLLNRHSQDQSGDLQKALVRNFEIQEAQRSGKIVKIKEVNTKFNIDVKPRKLNHFKSKFLNAATQDFLDYIKAKKKARIEVQVKLKVK